MQPTNLLSTVSEWFWITTKNQKMLLLWQCIGFTILLLWTLQPVVLNNVLLRNGQALVKLMLWFALIVYIPELLKFFQSTKFKFPSAKLRIVGGDKTQVVNSDNTQMIDWLVPVEWLIELIIQESWFPTVKAKEMFGITNEQYKKVGDNLERVGILTRGINNARVLATQNMRYIIDVLSSSPDSDRLWVYTDGGVDYQPQR